MTLTIAALLINAAVAGAVVIEPFANGQAMSEVLARIAIALLVGGFAWVLLTGDRGASRAAQFAITILRMLRPVLFHRPLLALIRLEAMGHTQRLPIGRNRVSCSSRHTAPGPKESTDRFALWSINSGKRATIWIHGADLDWLKDNRRSKL